MKGYLISKHFKKLKHQFYFFKRLHKKIVVRDVIECMKKSFIYIKDIKNRLLKGYVNHCACKIQKVFRGFYARNYLVKIKRAFSKTETRFRAIIIAWRLRRVMKTKEIENYTIQIKDYREALNELSKEKNENNLQEINKEELVKGLTISKYNTIIKMIGLISKMQLNGLWILYK